MLKLGGVFNVLSTPLNNNDEIDSAVFEKEIEWLLKCGMNGAVLAMVSEVLRFNAAERREQWKMAVKFLNGRVPLVVSVGAESSAIAVKLAKDAQSDGASALMATPPSAFAATAACIARTENRRHRVMIVMTTMTKMIAMRTTRVRSMRMRAWRLRVRPPVVAAAPSAATIG